jgi:di/tricarboxylate transporter
MGHQVNLMVLGPGGYRFSDFARVGLPLCLYYWAFVSLALAW